MNNMPGRDILFKVKKVKRGTPPTNFSKPLGPMSGLRVNLMANTQNKRMRKFATKKEELLWELNGLPKIGSNVTKIMELRKKLARLKKVKLRS